MGNINNSGPGFDPIQNPSALASLEGSFLRKLFTLKLRTRNYFYLTLMFVFGVAVTGFMGVALYAISTSISPAREPNFTYYLVITFVYLYFLLIFCVGALLFINFLINLGVLLGIVKTAEGKINQKRQKKKLPKRRKDYK